MIKFSLSVEQISYEMPIIVKKWEFVERSILYLTDDVNYKSGCNESVFFAFRFFSFSSGEIDRIVSFPRGNQMNN